MTRLSSLLGLVLVSVSPALGGPPATDPWAPFEQAPGLLQEMARTPAADPDAAVEILTRDVTLSVDKTGAIDRRSRMIYVIRDESGVMGWGTVEMSWMPWHQNRPEVNARVISSDGREHWLDPSNIGEFVEDESSMQLYGDTKILKGPLPGIAPGSIVEVYYRVSDTRPSFAAGTVIEMPLGHVVPVRKASVSVSSAPGITIRYATNLLPKLEIHEDHAPDGGSLLRFNVAALDPVSLQDFTLPSSKSPVPSIRVSTGDSWEEVAAEYSRQLKTALDPPSTKDLARKLIDGATSKQEKLERIFRYASNEIRYTGVIFGSRALIPDPPMATVNRGFGDCKDKAALMVNLLANAGIESRIALVSAGPGPDIDPNLPGIGGFDHAIVHVPGGDPEWFDPTRAFSRIDQLPLSSQGRLSLPVVPESARLLITPSSRRSENRIVEHSEIHLPFNGGSRITETTTWHGEFEASRREGYARAGSDLLEKSIREYASQAYQSDTLESFTYTDPSDFSAPMKLQIEVDEARVAVTAPPTAFATVPLGSITDGLPAPLLPTLESGTRSGSSAGKDEEAHSIDQFYIPVPHRREMSFRIHPPPGYAAQDLPQARTRSFGPASLSESYEIEEDGSVLVTARFDTGPGRITRAEADAMRDSLKSFFDEPVSPIYFHQTADVLLQSGRIVEAMEELTALAEKHPGEASIVGQMAQVMLAAGLGEEAVEKAGLAARMDGKSPQGHRNLGWIMLHDPVGRLYREGFDHDGAENSLRRALEIDPNDMDARWLLATLLERNKLGVPYGKGSRLEEAVREYEIIREGLGPSEADLNLLLALFHEGRLQEVLQKTTGQSPAPAYPHVRLAAIAVLRSSGDAISEAVRLTDDRDSYREALAVASQLLFSSRHYTQSAELIAAAARGHADSMAMLKRAQTFKRIRHHESFDATTESVEGLFRLMFRLLLTSETPTEALTPILYSGGRQIRESDSNSLRTHLFPPAVRALFAENLVTSDTILDLIFSMSSINSEKIGTSGARVKYTISTPGLTKPLEDAFYVAREEGEYRLIASRGNFGPVGHYVTRMIDRGDREEAAMWLDVLTRDLERGESLDPLSGHALHRFWPAEEGEKEASMKFAAAAVMAGPDLAGKALRILDEGREGAETPDEKADFDLAILRIADMAGMTDRAFEASEALYETHPESNLAAFSYMKALRQKKDWPRLSEVVEARLRKDSSDWLARTVKAEVAEIRREGEPGTAVLLKELADSGQATPAHYNNLAWQLVLDDSVDEETLEIAHRAVPGGARSRAAALHTLAVVYAELGQVEEARDVLWRVLDARGRTQPGPEDWYVFGRIAESLGLAGTAEKYYSRTLSTPGENGEELATVPLARRRMQLMSGLAARRR